MVRLSWITLITFIAVSITSCGANSNGETAYNGRSTFSLWDELATEFDTKTIMLIEAELASRGEMRTWSGDQYIGQKSSSTVGKSIYSRSNQISGDKNCSDFSNSIEAQRFFLSVGGPVNDPNGLDGDGDGNACEWGKTLQKSVAARTQYVAEMARITRPITTASQCYTGPRGGTYTITGDGTKNYDGC